MAASHVGCRVAHEFFSGPLQNRREETDGPGSATRRHVESASPRICDVRYEGSCRRGPGGDWTELDVGISRARNLNKLPEWRTIGGVTRAISGCRLPRLAESLYVLLTHELDDSLGLRVSELGL